MNDIRPFSTGSQAADWISRNCEKCQKRFRHDQKKYHCRWQKEIDVAYMTTGTISARCADAIGMTAAGNGLYTWDCPSKIPKNALPGNRRPRAIPGQKSLFDGENNV